MTLASASNNPTVSLTSFIGRERDLDELAGLFTGGTARLVTLTGAGGCGKTRLARALADRLNASALFVHGVCMVELAALSAPDLVGQTVAAALGLPAAHDQPTLEALCQYLQPRAVLLLLDNCEHLLAACADLARRLLDAAPQVSVLATSREPLGLPDETVWLVPSLSLPDAQPTTPLHVWLQAEAMQLFTARAQAALPSFRLTADNAAAVADICRRLDGIPLAIELAAARVKMLDVEQIAARLGDGLQLLTRGRRESAPRHQTMRAALDWSFSLLSSAAQQLFCRLSVFAGGFTLEAAEQVGADDQESGALPAGEVLNVLSDLVDKSMVWIAERPAHEPVRYRLLEPIRQYAHEKLRQSGAEPATRDRHLAYFVAFAEHAEPQLQTGQQRQWLRRLDQEHDNLRAALAWSGHALGQPLAGLRLAKALHRYWYQRGHAREGRNWLDQLIAQHDASPMVELLNAERSLARALVADGWLAVVQGDFRVRPPDLERGLALARQCGDATTEAQALGLISLLCGYRSDAWEVLRQYDEACVASARRSGDTWTMAWAVHLVGLHTYYHAGKPELAGPELAMSETLFAEVGDQRWLAVVGNLRGILTAKSGDYATAQTQYESALAIAETLDDQELQWKELFNLGGLAVVQGDAGRAHDLYTRASALARRLGAKVATADSLQGLAQAHMMRGEWEAARPLLRESLALLGDTGPANCYARLLSKFARLAAEYGQTVPAARALGAIDSYASQHRVLVDADEHVPVDQIRAWVRAAMRPHDYEAAHASGQNLRLEDAMQALLAIRPWSAVAAGQPSAPPPGPSRPALQLFALGPMRIVGETAVPLTWPYAKVKELLFYLASHPPRTKAQIGLALWPEASSTQLRNSLGTTLYHLRRVLNNPEWIIFEDDQYRFNRARGAQFDVDVFETSLAQAAQHKARAPELALEALQAAVDGYQGDFVEDLLDGEWFRLRREVLRRQYLDGLLDLGQLHFARGDYAAAAAAYRRAIEKENVLESAHRELMRCYARLGEHGQALRHYQTLEQVMWAELGSQPAPESLALYDQLKRGVSA